ncbi:MAG TPA: type II toxin-antitoxin system HicB family antitoxin [Thermoplasmata archaeon]|nr:type II toxin-antitoxin system HicB family antitoxin [Thermoplasmata archaeon]
MAFTARIWRDEGGFFVAQSEELPGCISQGKTLEEARRNFAEALEGYLETLAKEGGVPPAPAPANALRVRFELLPA